jgi:hypothetical protein
MSVTMVMLVILGCQFLDLKKTGSTPRFDGVYQSEKSKDSWDYLRFYGDSAVITVGSSGTPEQVIRWFEKENSTSPFSRGKYQTKDGKISFSSTSSAGTVDYEGTMTENGMTLNIHSQINGYRATKEYYFVKIAK